MLFAGVEVQAVRVMDMKTPSRGYPTAIGLGAPISVLIFALGALPIAAVLPYEKISLQSGVFDAFGAVSAIFSHMGWAVSALSRWSAWAPSAVCCMTGVLRAACSKPRMRVSLPRYFRRGPQGYARAYFAGPDHRHRDLVLLLRDP